MNEVDHWKLEPGRDDVGIWPDRWVCRYCGAPVINEYGPWYQKSWDDEFGQRTGSVRDATPRIDWKANHADWCIVPIHLDREGMGPR